MRDILLTIFICLHDLFPDFAHKREYLSNPDPLWYWHYFDPGARDVFMTHELKDDGQIGFHIHARAQTSTD